MEQFWNIIIELLEGFGNTLMLFAVTLVFAFPLGLLLAFGSMSKFKPLKWFVKTLIWIIRGTPLMLQLIFVYFAPPYIFGVGINRNVAAIIAMSINYAAYFAEIYRSGFQSIPVGQYEAAKVLGFSKMHTFFRIIVPQVFKRILPAVGNEVITRVKDTALVQVIGVIELFHVAHTQSGRLVSVMPLFIAGVIYFVLNWIVSKSFDFMEKKLAYYK